MRSTWRRVLIAATFTIIALGSGILPERAQAAEEKELRAVLEEVLDILKEKGQIGEEKYRELKARAQKGAEEKGLAGIDGLTPYVASPDGQHKVELHGRLDFDLRAYENGARKLDAKGTNQDPNRPDLATNFLVRRARIGIDATFYKVFSLSVEGDFGEGEVELTDGYIELNYWPEFRVRAGQFKVPFSFEELTSERFTDFVERAAVNNLVPGRDVGLMFHGALLGNLVEYAGGLFNGGGQNAAETNDSKDLAGRVLVRPFKGRGLPILEGLHLAANVTHGDQDSGRSLRGRTDGKFEFFSRVATRGDRLRYGVEAVYAYGPFGLYGEYIQSEEERRGLGAGGADLDDLTGKGWYLATTFFITGEEKIHKKAPRLLQNFDPRTGGWGALELVARYSQLDFDSNDLVGNRVGAFTLGLNWHLRSNIRLMLNWTQNWFEDGDRSPIRGDETSWEILSRLGFWF